MRRILTGLSASAALFMLFAGCENPFTGNVFSTFDEPDSPQSAAEVTALVESGGVEALVDELANLSQSSAFYDELVEQDLANPEEPSALDQILEELGAVYTNADGTPVVDPAPEDVPLIQQAALIAADIELNTSNGAEVVDSLVTAAFGLIGDTGGGTEPAPGQSFESIVSDMINASFGSLTGEEFTETLSSLKNAAVAYEAFGGTVEGERDATTDEVISVTAPEDANIEAVAQNAAVAIVLTEIVVEYEAATGQTINSQEELTALATSAADTSDPGYAESSAIITAAVTNLETNTSFDNILVASGLADLLNLGGTQ